MDNLFRDPKTVGKLGLDTKAFWERGEPNWPQFLTPSGVKYHRSPFKDMGDRGIENRLMESLANCLPNGTVIAGGFMTAVMGNNKDAQDIDLFFLNPHAFAKAFNTLMDPENEIADFSEDEHWAAQGGTPWTPCRRPRSAMKRVAGSATKTPASSSSSTPSAHLSS
jgi:hypothetical protein